MRALTVPLVAALSVIFLSAMPSTATVHAAGSLYPATSAKQAVSILLADVTGRPIRAGCHPYQGVVTPADMLATCPVTPRLRNAILHASRGLNVVCRCENTPRQVTVFDPVTTSTGTYVEAYFDFGPGSFVTTYLLVKRPGGWLVDDMYCLRHPETSVYTARAGLACP